MQDGVLPGLLEPLEAAGPAVLVEPDADRPVIALGEVPAPGFRLLVQERADAVADGFQAEGIAAVVTGLRQVQLAEDVLRQRSLGVFDFCNVENTARCRV